jgi:hypothetical protein
MKMNIMSGLHPFLFTIFPIFLLFSQNLDSLTPKDIIFPLVLFLGITITSLLILHYIFKNSVKSGIVISLLWVIFFSYGYIFAVFDISIFQDIYYIQQHALLMTPFLGVLIVGILIIVKTKRKLNNATTIITVMAIALIVFPAVNITTYYFQQNENYENYETVNFIQDVEIENAPNIYYIILDEYAPQKTLLDTFSFDNSNFLDYLREKGFYVASESYANYSTTFQTLASVLNMEYVNWIGDEIEENSNDHHLAYKLVEKNKVMSFLKSKGYVIANTDSGYEISRTIQSANLNLCGENQLFNSEFLVMTLRNSILNPIYVKMFEPGFRERTLCTFDEIPKVQFKTDKPVFVFSHILLPHGPYFWGPNGEHLTPGKYTLEGGYDRPVEGYLDQLQFVNKKMKVMIEEILSSSNRQSIIVIQSDTGPSINYQIGEVNEKMIKERLSTVTFVYLPNNQDVFYEGITPVNVFPIIFNTFFDENFEILEDKSYFSLEENVYRFQDVTEFIRERGTIDMSFWRK